MKAEKFPVAAACEVAEVSTSAYYEWLDRTESPTAAELDEAHLVNEMIDIHRDSEGTYGSPRVTAALRRQGYCVNHKRAERLMGTYGIVGLVERRRRPRTTMAAEGAPPLPDLIGQDFRPGEPDRRWCGDITYVPTGEGWLYLASVLDLGSRRLIGWAMDATMPTGLVSGALERAVDLRGGDVAGVIFHTDRGSQTVPGVPGALRSTPDPPVCRPGGYVFRQQCRGIVLVHAEARARSPIPVRHTRRGHRRHHGLDPPLQQRWPSLHPRLRAAG